MKNSSFSYQERIPTCSSPVAKKLLVLIAEKKTNLGLSADVTSSEQLIELADNLGSEICLLKTHIDIIDDFTPTLIKKLQNLAEKHQFLLFEDRKFADIGNTVKQQYAGGIYRIAEWADIINAHVFPGPGIIKGLFEATKGATRGLVLLAEMSSEGHLMDATYQQQVMKMAEQYPHFIVGFITQRALGNHPQWIHMTPGVKFAESSDYLGQQYTTPKIAIQQNGSDIIIVGRGITHASNPLIAAKQYRQAGWDAYLQRLRVAKVETSAG